MNASRARHAPLLLTIIAVLLALVAPMGRAGAATTITEPSARPYLVALDTQGRPKPFTVAASGFPAGSLVYVEQCDPQPTSAPNWAPTRNCDIGSSPAPAIVDANGRARFDAGDRNHAFQPFVGLGPEGLFNCLTPDAKSPKNGLPEFRACQVRVSSNNNQSTTDQVFLPIVFGNSSSAPGATAKSGSSSNSHGVRRGHRGRARPRVGRDMARGSSPPERPLRRVETRSRANALRRLGERHANLRRTGPPPVEMRVPVCLESPRDLGPALESAP